MNVEWRIRVIWVFLIKQLKTLWVSQTRINNWMKCLVAEKVEILLSSLVTADLPCNIRHGVRYSTCRRPEGRCLRLLLPVSRSGKHQVWRGEVLCLCSGGSSFSISNIALSHFLKIYMDTFGSPWSFYYIRAINFWITSNYIFGPG